LLGFFFDPEDGSEKVPRSFLDAVSLLTFIGPENGGGTFLSNVG
jgi:hypothetical protein